MKTKDDLYIVLEDLLRIGNTTSPKLDHVRERDIASIYHEGKNIVFPQTGGFLLLTKYIPECVVSGGNARLVPRIQGN